MNENREIIPNKKRFITRLYDIFELIKSKIDKNYTLKINRQRSFRKIQI